MTLPVGNTDIADSSSGSTLKVNSDGSLLARVNTTTLFTQNSQVVTSSADSGSLNVANCYEVGVFVNVSALAGTTPSIQFFVDTLGSDAVWYNLYSSTSITTAATVIKNIGLGGAINQSIGTTIRLRWSVGGTSPQVTFSASVIGK